MGATVAEGRKELGLGQSAAISLRALALASTVSLIACPSGLKGHLATLACTVLSHSLSLPLDSQHRPASHPGGNGKSALRHPSAHGTVLL
jgi:hypothetical protein